MEHAPMCLSIKNNMRHAPVLLLGFIISATVIYGQTDKKTSIMTKAPTCKLTTPELQERKKTVIAELKSLVVERKETATGVQYKFDGSDKMIDLLTSFIKTERLCCDFFTFDLSVGSEEKFIWLELSGPEGTKDFIETEIGF
jgi:hypothetical protein